MTRVEWDYTEHAAHYDSRADYSRVAIVKVLNVMGCEISRPIADIGAGTGKLTKELLALGFTVKSIEPNDAMRAIGSRNNAGSAWSDGTGEKTGLPDSSVYAALFGSSFNVVDQQACLKEVCRILVPGGWFACMWNHRDLQDPTQNTIEDIIKSHVRGYGYGLRREDPSTAIRQSGLFSDAKLVEGRVSWPMTLKDNVTAWRSHATLRRQAGSDQKFAAIIDEIEALLKTQDDPLFVPYVTRIYYAQLTAEKKDLRAKRPD